MTIEKVEVIDKKFRVLKIVSRAEAIKKNLKENVVLIIVKNSKNQFYIHQRNKIKKIFPLRWVTGAGGGVLAGESFDDAAKRELKEELGITSPIKYLFDFDYKTDINNYKAKVYFCIYDGKINLNKKECEKGCWVSKQGLKKYIKSRLLCPDTALYTQKYLEEFDQ